MSASALPLIVTIAQHNRDVQSRKSRDRQENLTSSGSRSLTKQSSCMPTLDDLISQKNVLGIIRQIKNGEHVFTWNIEEIIASFPLSDAKKVLMALAAKGGTVFAHYTSGVAILKLPEDTAYEVLLRYVQQGGHLDYMVCEECCQNLSHEHAKEIMLELSRHRKFFLAFSADAKKVVPELCN